MLIIIHALIGSLIGQELSSVTLIILTSLIIHFIFDAIPHWDGPFEKEYFEITGDAIVKKLTLYLHLIDFIISIILIIFIYHEFHSKLMILGAIISILPDVVKIGYKTRLRDRKPYMRFLRFHSKIQKDIGWKIGLLIQVIIILILLKVIF